MECKDGYKHCSKADFYQGEIEWKRRRAYASRLQLALAASLPFPIPAQAMRTQQFLLPVFPPPAPAHAMHIHEPNPFMNNMEEISYWVSTKRAPCLLNYDNLIKRQNEVAHCSKTTPRSVASVEIPPATKKRRKVKLLDDSASSDKQQAPVQNVYFAKSHTHNQNDKVVPKTCRSNSPKPMLDFNIEEEVQTKPKTVKVQRKRKVSLTNDKMCTSTPKVTSLRRSLRKTQQPNYSYLNGSFEMLNASDIIQEQDKHEIKCERVENKSNFIKNFKNNMNGQSDSSDVSGFTANYIRSTKIHSSKVTPKAQNKRKELKSKKQEKIEEKIVVPANKTEDTGNLNTNILNSSSDSSQNIITLVTPRNRPSNKLDKSTPLLKEENVKNNQDCSLGKKVGRPRTTKILETSFQSTSSMSRYPKRSKKISVVNSEKDCDRLDTSEAVSSPAKVCSPKLSESERKENSVNVLSKTRSGKKIGFDTDQDVSGSSLNVNNANEQVSSGVTLNVDNQQNCTKKRAARTRTPRNTSARDKKDVKGSISDTSDKNVDESPCSLIQLRSRSGRLKKNMNETGHMSQRDSLRDKSGFATCFSDSDSDNEPLKQRKFFC